MAVYNIGHDHRYTNIAFTDLADYRKFVDIPFQGQPAKIFYSQTWKAFYAQKSKNKPNCPYLGSAIFVVDEIAGGVIAPHVCHEVELLPMEVEGKPFHVVNITHIVDCLDKANSVIEYFDDEQTRIMSIEKYSFFEERLFETFLFKLPGFSSMYSTPRFKNLIEARKITGLRFDPLTSAEAWAEADRKISVRRAWEESERTRTKQQAAERVVMPGVAKKKPRG